MIKWKRRQFKGKLQF